MRRSQRGSSTWRRRRASLSSHYEHQEVGYNYRMSNLLAALGRAQLEGLPGKIARRTRDPRDLPQRVRRLRRSPADAESRRRRVECLADGHNDRPSVALRFTATSLREHLAAAEIESRPIWKPMHLQPAFAGARIRGGDVAEELFDRGLCLPSGSSLSPEQQDLVVRAIDEHAVKDVRAT